MLSFIFPKTFCFNCEAFNVALNGGAQNLKNADLSLANTAQDNFCGIDLQGSNLTNANVSQSDLTEANLSKAILIETSFFKSILINANLQNTLLLEANFYKANLSGADLSFSENFLNKLKRILKQKTVTKQQYRINLNFKKANLTKAKLNNTLLINANFNDAILIGTDFRGADISGANFENAKLQGIIVADVNFYGVKGLSEEQKEYLARRGAINVYWDEKREGIEEGLQTGEQEQNENIQTQENVAQPVHNEPVKANEAH